MTPFLSEEQLDSLLLLCSETREDPWVPGYDLNVHSEYTEKFHSFDMSPHLYTWQQDIGNFFVKVTRYIVTYNQPYVREIITDSCSIFHNGLIIFFTESKTRETCITKLIDRLLARDAAEVKHRCDVSQARLLEVMEYCNVQREPEDAS